MQSLLWKGNVKRSQHKGYVGPGSHAGVKPSCFSGEGSLFCIHYAFTLLYTMLLQGKAKQLGCAALAAGSVSCCFDGAVAWWGGDGRSRSAAFSEAILGDQIEL